MIVEFFGLSKTGKSILIRKLENEGKKVVKVNDASFLKKFFFFLKYLAKHPLNFIFLLYKMNTNWVKIFRFSFCKYFKVFLMRNSYFIAALSKHERIKHNKENIFSDELLLQSLFMVFQKKSTIEEIKTTLKKLPKSDFVFLFERNKEQRHKIYRIPHPEFNNPTMFPGGWVDKNYAVSWMENMEYNYELIKQEIFTYYKEDKEFFSKIKPVKGVSLTILKLIN